MVIYFYRPRADTPRWVKAWDRLFKPRFTHCNIRVGDSVYDLGQDAPRITEWREALELRSPTKMVLLPDDWIEEGSIRELAGIRATPVKSALYVLGWKRPRIYNCASFISLILQSGRPSLPICYTPDELDEQLERIRSNSCLHQAAPRLASQQGSKPHPKDRRRIAERIPGSL